MSRRRRAQRRDVLADAVYASKLVSRFINVLFKDGKKSKAERIFYKALEFLSSEYDVKDSFQVFKDAIHNVRPVLKVSSVRVGGANFQVPQKVDEFRGMLYSVRWIISAASKRPPSDMYQKLGHELFDASQEKGGAIKKKNETHKIAEANKAYSHFAKN